MVLAGRAALEQNPPGAIHDEDGKRAMQRSRSVCAELFLRADVPIVAVDEYDSLFARQVIDFPPGWTKRHPKRPLMQRLPSVMELLSGEVDFTIAPSCS